jgi:CubicO group peptidase (beta-lactamase class C family)
VDGVRLLSPRTIDRIFEEQSNGPDLVIGEHLRFGIGYGLPVPQTLPAIPDRRICFWGGWGGSIIVNDLDHKMSVAYMMNLMEGGTLGGPRADAILNAVYAVMDG